MEKQKQSGLGIASLILGIVGLISCCIIIGIIPCIIGLILGIIALSDKKYSHGTAIAGVVCCGFGIALFIIVIISGFFSEEEFGIKDSSSSQVEQTQSEMQTETQNQKSYREDLTWEILSRESDEYKGEFIKVSGEVLQVKEELFGGKVLRISDDALSQEVYWIEYEKDITELNILEGDYIVVSGTFVGIQTYTALLGNEISVPKIEADIIEISSEDVENNKKISVQLPNAPITINDYNWQDEISDTIYIESIEYTIEKNYNNNFTISIYFTGEKTLGDNGYNYIPYKLYDSDGYVVESGNFMTEKLSSGEKFKNLKATIYDVEPGKYKLELYDYK